MKYNWIEIQQAHDLGMTWRDLRCVYGCSMGALAKAKIRGDLETRTRSAATVLKIATYGPTIMGQAARARTSLRQSMNNKGGRCKWYPVGGVKVQGTWERNVATKLTELEIKWERPTAEDSFEYELKGTKRRYTPDFYLPEFNYYLEIKGRWWGMDKQKMEMVFDQHPYHRIVMVHEPDYLECMKE